MTVCLALIDGTKENNEKLVDFNIFFFGSAFLWPKKIKNFYLGEKIEFLGVCGQILDLVSKNQNKYKTIVFCFQGTTTEEQPLGDKADPPSTHLPCAPEALVLSSGIRWSLEHCRRPLGSSATVFRI